MLHIEALSASYRGLKALQGVSLDVAKGEIVAVVGANGAGKTTLLKSVAGLVATEGTITFDGQDLRRLKPHMVPAPASAWCGGPPPVPRLRGRQPPPRRLRHRRARPLQAAGTGVLPVPRLQERLPQRAETLSGGEQQMLAIGRALMSQPRLLMLDEPSQGIMPKLVDDIFAAIQRIRDLGMTILLVEQRLAEALEIADRAYVLQTGRIVMSGKASDIASDDAVRRAYLGL